MDADDHADHVQITIEFDWKDVGKIEWRPSGRLKYPNAPELLAAGTYRIHAGGWPLQAAKFEECWYVGMSTTSMKSRIQAHMGERGMPHQEGPKAFRWILENGGWVRVWGGAHRLVLNGVGEEYIDRERVGRGIEAAGILSNLSYMGRRNLQL